jgi:hypothetical protein
MATPPPKAYTDACAKLGIDELEPVAAAFRIAADTGFVAVDVEAWTTFRLHRRKIGDADLAAILVAVQSCGLPLWDLSLRSQAVTDAVIEYLIAVLPSADVRRLNLAANGLTGEGIRALLPALLACPSLTHVDVSHQVRGGGGITL